MTELETLPERRAREFAEWVARIFGAPEAYLASLPRSVWLRGDCGWVSYPR